MATATPRTRLPALDVAAVRDRATARTNEALTSALNARDATDRSVAQFAATLVLEAEAALKDASAYRDKLMLSLVAHEGYPAAQVASAAGTSRAWMLKMLDRKLGTGDGTWTMKSIPKVPEARAEVARKAGVLRYSNAPAELPEVAAQIVKHKAVIDAAMPVRDEKVRALEHAGVSRGEIAKMIGRNPSRVSHLTAGKAPVAP